MTPSKLNTQASPFYISLKRSAALCLLISSSLSAAIFSACDDVGQSPLAGVEVLAGQDGGSEDPEWRTEAELASEGTVMSVWGTGELVYAVGGQPNAGRVWSRPISDEAGEGSWTALTGVPDGPLLNWVHGAEGHLWVVGSDGRALRSVEGGAWESFDSGTTQDLWGVFAVSASEVWAVGGDANGEGDAAPVLIRFDGVQWSPVPVPELDRSGVRALFKVWGDGAGQVWAVGMKGVIIAELGEGWTQQQVSPAEGSPPNAEDLISLWGVNGELVAVGGRSNGVIARWDGSAWRSQTISGLPGLNGVWMDPSGTAHAVGVRGSAVTIESGSFEVSRERTYSTLVLHAIWSDELTRWAVGGTLDNSPPWEGLILAD